MSRHVDVVVIGAGLAGLAAARRLARAGRDFVIVEAGDAPGGRIRTDRVDGLRLDRGFQVFNPYYREARRVLDLPRLQLQPFAPGIAVRHDSGLSRMADPIRSPRTAFETLTGPGSLTTKMAAVRWLAEVGFGPVDRIRHRVDRSLSDELDRRGIDGQLSAVITQFLAGVLAEDRLTTSRRFAELLVRSFVRGTPSLPADGIQAIPEQLAARLPAGTLLLNEPVRSLTRRSVRTDVEEIFADHVVVAVDPQSAAELTGIVAPRMKAITTFYHRAATPPQRARWLHVDITGSGPVINVAAVSAVAPRYADGGILIASTVLGEHDGTLERTVRQHASAILGVNGDDWEFVAHYPVGRAIPTLSPGQPMRRPTRLDDGVLIAGDYRDTGSIQGALVSGRRVAEAVLAAETDPSEPSDDAAHDRDHLGR